MNTQPTEFTPKQAAGLVNHIVREGFNREHWERVKQVRSLTVSTAELKKEKR